MKNTVLKEQPDGLIQRLADGLALSIGAAVGPRMKVDSVKFGLRLTIHGDQMEFDLDYPWDLGIPIAENIVGCTEIVLNLIQAELAEATTEPWPAQYGSRVADARGLPAPEPKLAGKLLELRFRYGSDVVALQPIDLSDELGGFDDSQGCS